MLAWTLFCCLAVGVTLCGRERSVSGWRVGLGGGRVVDAAGRFLGAINLYEASRALRATSSR